MFVVVVVVFATGYVFISQLPLKVKSIEQSQETKLQKKTST